MSLNIKKTTFIRKKRSKANLKTEKIPSKLTLTEENKTGPWDKSEDERLTNWVAKNGARNWAKCAKEVKTRNGKQCREHWKNKLNENIKKGNWTPEEDLLILKFYEKFQSWKKMIPVFENRTINSIKNRFFSILRKIAIKKEIYGNTDMVAKLGLDKLKQFLDEAVEEAENIYFYENKEQTKEQFEKFMDEIEDNLKYVRKGKFLDLNNLRTKNFNNVDKNNNNSFISIKDIIITNVDDNKDTNDNMKIKKDYNSDSISYSEHDDEDEKKSEIPLEENIKKKKTFIKKISKKENPINLTKSISMIKNERESSDQEKTSDYPKNSNTYSNRATSNFLLKPQINNSIDFKEKQSSQNNELIKKKSSSKNKNNNNIFELPLNQNIKINTKISSRSSILTNKKSSFYILNHNISKNDPNKFCFNTSSRIESAIKGKNVNPCSSFS